MQSETLSKMVRDEWFPQWIADMAAAESERQVGELASRLGSLAAYVESPIERRFVHALLLESDASIVEMVRPDDEEAAPMPLRLGEIPDTKLVIHPQRRLGRYRVDFYLAFIECGLPFSEVLVECDGHDWHDRTKKQAAHDRKRQNWLIAQGFQILRFTGSQIHHNAVQCASDTLDLLYPIRVRARALRKSEDV